MRTRENRITLRLSDKEYEKLKTSAEKVGVPREEIGRASCRERV